MSSGPGEGTGYFTRLEVFLLAMCMVLMGCCTFLAVVVAS